MAKKLSPQLIAARKRMKAEQKKILTVAAEEAVQFFQDKFSEREGFLDTRVRKWKPRKREDKTFKTKGTKRGILIGPGGGTLWRSISRTSLNSKRTVIGIKGKANKYASVHNYGLRAGRGKGFKMPKRQFMGESKTLNRKIVRLIKKRIKKIL